LSRQIDIRSRFIAERRKVGQMEQNRGDANSTTSGGTGEESKASESSGTKIFPPSPIGLSHKKLDWKTYEAYVLGCLRSLIPDAKVTHDAKIRGLRSGRLRQIDILVERNLGTFKLAIAVDCKAYGRKVTVKHVEQFLGMLDDLRISKGVLMTTNGYTKAAWERAQNESRDIELRILTVEQLSDFQWIGAAVLWRGPVAVMISPPQHWVIDNEHTPIPGAKSNQNIPHFMSYPLGHTRQTAARREAFIYGTIILKWPGGSTVEEIAAWNESQVLEKCPTASFKRLALTTLSRPEATYFRVGRIHAGYGGPEYSLYLDHPKGVLLVVLICPESKDGVYVPMLEKMAQHAILMDCDDSRLAEGVLDVKPCIVPGKQNEHPGARE
jgi:hypothetical protein